MSRAPEAFRDPALLRLLRCPATGVALRALERDGRSWLATHDGSVRYPIEDGVPVLLAERAQRDAPGVSAGGP